MATALIARALFFALVYQDIAAATFPADYDEHAKIGDEWPAFRPSVSASKSSFEFSQTHLCRADRLTAEATLIRHTSFPTLLLRRVTDVLRLLYPIASRSRNYSLR